jgi:hypothetical protein
MTEKKGDWKDPEVEEYLAYARRLLVQTMEALPGAHAEAVAVVLDKILPPLYYWREEQRRATAQGAPAEAGAQKAQTQKPAPAAEDPQKVLEALKWHPMKSGPGEWTFAVDREGSPRPELARLVEELKGGRRIRIGGYEYELSDKFLHRFPATAKS